ncbi:MAG: MFS transporter [Acidiferrobacterales bacterium]|nr:MFS transporter [Acidiferrobacterales bacterium]
MSDTGIKRLLNKQVVSWALYDWANSAFATTVMAGVFPIFYSSLSQDLSTKDAQFWFNITLLVSSIAVAIAAPILGAIADAGGGRKKFLATFAMLGITMAAALAWVNAGMWVIGLVIYGLGKVGFAGANIFYDAMLVDVADEDDFDLVSGFGYALGYIGGGLLFLINVLMITKPELFGIASTASAVSLSFLSVAIWWAVFTIPLLRNLPERQSQTTRSAGEAIRDGFAQLRQTFAEIRHLKPVLIFLCAYWLYIDGVGSIIKMAVFFGSRVLSLPDDSLITALLITQFVAFPAALFFGWLGSKIGPRNGIFIGLVVYVLAVLYAWGRLETAADFYKLAIAIGLVQGGVQSLSRSLFARLIPREKATEFFGFFNMVGKFATILGPSLMALVPVVFATAEDRDVILVVILLFIAGGLFLSRVENVKAGK